MIMGVDPGLASTGIAILDGLSVVYRATVKTTKAEADADRCRAIARAVVEAVELMPCAVWIEDYEFQGAARTGNRNAIRMARLVGWIAGATDGRLVSRNTWGRALGVKNDAQQRARLSQLTGERLHNAHERDAACVAIYGARR